MSLKIINGKVLPIGVDLGTTAIKMAQLRLTGDNIDLMAAAVAEMPPEAGKTPRGRMDFIGSSLRLLLRSHPFKGRQCVLSLPAEATFVQHVKVPRGPAESLRDSVLAEINGKMPFPAERAEIRCIPAGEVAAEGQARQEVIVVAASRETVETYLSAAKKAKLDVVGINVEPCAIVECFARLFRRGADARRTLLFIDLGHNSTQVVLTHGSRMVFARNLGIAGRRFDQAVAETLKIPVDDARRMRRRLAEADTDESQEEIRALLAGPLDALADELTQCLRYYESVFRNQAIERAIFLGGQAHDKRLCQAIAQRLNMPAQIGDPLVRVGRPEGVGLDSGVDHREPQPRWAVAVGLSLGAAA
jgi:type IV pilus assembly protein PilM